MEILLVLKLVHYESSPHSEVPRAIYKKRRSWDTKDDRRKLDLMLAISWLKACC